MVRLIFKDSKLIVFKDDTGKWLAFGAIIAKSDAEQYLLREAKKQIIFELLTGQGNCHTVADIVDCLTKINDTPKFDYYINNYLTESDLEAILQASDAFLEKQEDEI